MTNQAKTKIERLAMPWGENLYRHEGRTENGFPVSVEHFNRDPEARRTLGRWSPCPNINVARRIAKAAP